MHVLTSSRKQFAVDQITNYYFWSGNLGLYCILIFHTLDLIHFYNNSPKGMRYAFSLKQKRETNFSV